MSESILTDAVLFLYKVYHGLFKWARQKTNLQEKTQNQLTITLEHDIVIAYAEGNKGIPTFYRIFIADGIFRSDPY
ncbi:MAG: hypothetical protein JW908_14265 [Anaerolineales bacterium]|nr:hypothetical protein [Anaerolineales bacterium]